MNRVWKQLVGPGIVSPPGDFGLAGSQPDQPELLDWLAADFVDEGWYVKQLTRNIA